MSSVKADKKTKHTNALFVEKTIEGRKREEKVLLKKKCEHMLTQMTSSLRFSKAKQENRKDFGSSNSKKPCSCSV